MDDKKPGVEVWNEKPAPKERSSRHDPFRSAKKQASSKVWWLGIGLVVIIIALFFLFRSGADSKTAEQISQTTAELTSQTQTLQTQLEQCQASLTQASSAVQNGTDAIAKAVSAVSAELKQCKTNLALTNEDADEKDAAIESLEASLADAARRLCCIQRVYDSAIDSYEIRDDTVVCGVNLDERISC